MVGRSRDRPPGLEVVGLAVGYELGIEVGAGSGSLLSAAATDDVRPGLATTEDAGSRGGPDVAGGGRGGRGGAQQPPDAAAQIDLFSMVYLGKCNNRQS